MLTNNKGIKVNPDDFRLECRQQNEDWNPEDQAFWQQFLFSPRGRRLVKWFLLEEQSALMGVAACDLTTDEGRLAGIRAQGRSMGMIRAIEALFELTEVHTDALPTLPSNDTP